MISIEHLLVLLLFQSVLGISIHKETRSFQDDPLAVTNLGSVRGLRADDGGNYSMFLGIPYARVDSSNKFGDSEPYPPFEEVFEAIDDNVRCPQYSSLDQATLGTIDCLRLNIFVPDTANAQNRLPVLFWIHPGQFEFGSSRRELYGAKYLTRHDVIIVSINYRLGPYGFMCLDIPEVPGNAGLKDQLRAMRWVNENIESFYGDPDRITLSGMSAGAMSTGLNLVSNAEKLYRNVIMMSGAAIYTGLMVEKDIEAPLKIAANLGYTTNDIHSALSFLSNADEVAVINAANEVGQFRPCVEREFPGVETFLSDYPINLAHRNAEGLSILQGFASHENMESFARPGPNTYTQALFSNRFNLNFNFDAEQVTELEGIVRRFYIGDNEISESMRSELIDFVSDYTFAYPPIRSIPRYLDSGAAKIYQYIFSYDGGRNFIKSRQNITIPGAAHTDDKGYLFDVDGLPEPTPEDQLVIDRMTTMWTNFVKYDDPTPEITELLPFKWEPITQDSPHHYLDIDSEMVVGKRMRHRRYSFWDLFYETNAEHETGYRNPDEENLETEEEEPDSASSVYLSPILVIAIIYNLIPVLRY